MSDSKVNKLVELADDLLSYSEEDLKRAGLLVGYEQAKRAAASALFGGMALSSDVDTVETRLFGSPVSKAQRESEAFGRVAEIARAAVFASSKQNGSWKDYTGLASAQIERVNTAVEAGLKSLGSEWKPKHQRLADKRQPINSFPAEANLSCVTLDVDSDRVELLHCAWADSGKSWHLSRHTVRGDTSSDSFPWRKLSNLLRRYRGITPGETRFCFGLDLGYLPKFFARWKYGGGYPRGLPAPFLMKFSAAPIGVVFSYTLVKAKRRTYYTVSDNGLSKKVFGSLDRAVFSSDLEDDYFKELFAVELDATSKRYIQVAPVSTAHDLNRLQLAVLGLLNTLEGGAHDPNPDSTPPYLPPGDEN